MRKAGIFVSLVVLGRVVFTLDRSPTELPQENLESLSTFSG